MASTKDLDDHDMLIQMKEAIEGFIQRVSSHLAQVEKENDRRFNELRKDLEKLEDTLREVEIELAHRKAQFDSFTGDMAEMRRSIETYKTDMENKLKEFKSWKWQYVLVWVTITGFVIGLVTWLAESVI